MEAANRKAGQGTILHRANHGCNGVLPCYHSRVDEVKRDILNSQPEKAKKDHCTLVQGHRSDGVPDLQ